jgi:hypothetical protein
MCVFAAAQCCVCDGYFYYRDLVSNIKGKNLSLKMLQVQHLAVDEIGLAPKNEPGEWPSVP